MQIDDLATIISTLPSSFHPSIMRISPNTRLPSSLPSPLPFGAAGVSLTIQAKLAHLDNEVLS